MEALFSEMFGGIFYGLSYADLAMPLGVLMWSMILVISLKGVDGNHLIAALVYAGYCSFAGVMLVIVLPEKYVRHHSNSQVMVWFVLFLVIPLLRWGMRLLKQRKLVQQRLIYGKEKSK